MRTDGQVDTTRPWRGSVTGGRSRGILGIDRRERSNAFSFRQIFRPMICSAQYPKADEIC